jgi:hypothetical protein
MIHFGGQVVNKARSHSKCPICGEQYKIGELRIVASGYMSSGHVHLKCLIHEVEFDLCLTELQRKKLK